jgi:hypothetical protein
LADVDRDLAASLATWRQDYKLEGADYGLTFTLPDMVNGESVMVELSEGGTDQAVTAENFDDFIGAVIRYKLVVSVACSFDRFAEGFNSVGETRVMAHLYGRDFEALLSGTDVVDWSELKQAAEYDQYTPLSPAVVVFWRIFDGWAHSDKSKFLQFATGSARAPLGGLRTMRFTISRTDDAGQIPSARTCTGQLILPDVREEEELRRRLEICVQNCVGFGFS